MKDKTVWAVYTDEHYLDSLWVTEANAKEYVKREQEKDPRFELYIWEQPLNNWGKRFGGYGE